MAVLVEGALVLDAGLRAAVLLRSDELGATGRWVNPPELVEGTLWPGNAKGAWVDPTVGKIKIEVTMHQRTMGPLGVSTAVLELRVGRAIIVNPRAFVSKTRRDNGYTSFPV
ncbi:MAG: hypothetical protein AAF989_00390 [Planctomycetota bacterium]